MRLLLTHLDACSPIELTDGEHVLGGAPDDDVFLAPLPPSFLTLRIEGPHLTLESRGSFRVDGLAFPAGRPRELMVGERVELPSEVAMQIAAQTPGPGITTRSLFLHLLGATLTPPAPHLAQLVCVAGSDRGRRFGLETAELQLGRCVEAQLRLRDSSVSRTHARLSRGTDCWWVEDLGGTNGVWVNGRPAPGRTALYDGAILELGRTMLRLTDGSTPAPAPMAAAVPGWRRWTMERGLWLSGLALALMAVLVGLLVLP